MADFVTLSCPSCGGKLEVTRDIERFACTHCGREHMVKRSGGTVSLSPVVDALRKVEVGVDKTAAELAIVRLQKEIEDLRVYRNSLLANSPRPQINVVFIFLILSGALIAVVALLTIRDNGNTSITCLTGGIMMGLIGLIPSLLHPSNIKRWEKTIGVQLKSLERQIAAKYSELQHYRSIVSR